MRTALSSPPSQDSRGIPGIRDEYARLVGLAKSDPRAFAPLYARYFDPVYRYCYRRLGHPEAAADAAAQVFAKALAALPGYREEAPSFRSWLVAIAHNVIVDDLRARRPVASLAAAAQVAATDLSPEETVLSQEAGCTVRTLLASCHQTSVRSWSCAWPGSPGQRSPRPSAAAWAPSRSPRYGPSPGSGQRWILPAHRHGRCASDEP